MAVSTDFKLTINTPLHATLSGTMRLKTIQDYAEALKPIHDDFGKASELYTITISDLEFLNSSGITSLARIVLDARKRKVPLTIKGSSNYPWQQKSLSTLTKLWDGFTLDLS